MKISRYIKITLIMLIYTFIFVGCSSNRELTETEKKLVGSWAYIHDKVTEIASFAENGEAKYEGKSFAFECDDAYITLKSKEGYEVKMRYAFEGDRLFLYKKTAYSVRDGGEHEGLVGSWISDDNLTFEFSNQSTFLEDGYFPGNYSVDEKAGTVKLMYTDHFEDTVFYYSLEGDKLITEYPWEVVSTEK